MDRNCQLDDRADMEPQLVSLPALSEALLQMTKAGGLVWSDSRRFPRFEANAITVLRSEGTYAALGHIGSSQEVWLRDLSRGGARFVHGAQLFPGERISLSHAWGSQLRLEVVWCRRISQGTFVSGCCFAVDEEQSQVASPRRGSIN